MPLPATTLVFAASIAFATSPAFASLFASAVATDGVAPAVIVPVSASIVNVSFSLFTVSEIKLRPNT